MKIRLHFVLAATFLCTILAFSQGDDDDRPVKEYPPIPQVEISVLFVRIDAGIAAKWGLDGGPPADPENTPLGKKIPRLMKPGAASKVFTALRKQPKTKILASATSTVQSGKETWVSATVERRFPENFEEPKIKMPDKDAKVCADFYTPTFGEPREDLGVTLTVTPQVAQNGRHIGLELHPKYVKVDGHDKGYGKAKTYPRFLVRESRTEVTVPDSCSIILGIVKPTAHSDDAKEDAEKIESPVLIWLTATIVKQPKED